MMRKNQALKNQALKSERPEFSRPVAEEVLEPLPKLSEPPTMFKFAPYKDCVVSAVVMRPSNKILTFRVGNIDYDTSLAHISDLLPIDCYASNIVEIRTELPCDSLRIKVQYKRRYGLGRR